MKLRRYHVMGAAYSIRKAMGFAPLNPYYALAVATILRAASKPARSGAPAVINR